MNGAQWVAVTRTPYSPNVVKMLIAIALSYVLVSWCESQWKAGNHRRVLIVAVLFFYSMVYVFGRF